MHFEDTFQTFIVCLFSSLFDVVAKKRKVWIVVVDLFEQIHNPDVRPIIKSDVPAVTLFQWKKLWPAPIWVLGRKNKREAFQTGIHVFLDVGNRIDFGQIFNMGIGCRVIESGMLLIFSFDQVFDLFRC